VWELDTAYTVDPDAFGSLGRATPFAGDRLYGQCVLTAKDGRITWHR